jgi:hypothetical protein
MSQTPSFSRAVKNSLTDETSLGELTDLIVAIVKEARRRWVFVVGCVVMGGLFGWALSFLVPPIRQKAEYIIAAEEESSPAWESLLAQFGLDVGGSNPSGVYQGESLVTLFKTRTMIERALLHPLNPGGADTTTLADRFFQDTKHAKKADFDGVNFKFSRAEHDEPTDSALYLTYKYVRDKVLDVSKPDKKQGFIHVACVHTDRQLAMRLSEVMINTVTDFYIESLTKKARKNLDVLKTESDSVQRELNRNLALTASLSDLNVNPLKQVLKTEQNRAVIDLQISMAVFGELVKNLQLAEIGLRKQTPLITVIESPVYPLEKVGLSMLKLLAIGIILGMALAVFLLYRAILVRAMQQKSELIENA